MKKTPRKMTLAAVVVLGALVAGACGDKKSSETTVAPETSVPSTEAPTTAPATTEPAGPSVVTYAAEQEYTSYNNGAADQGLFANTLVLNQLLPGPIYFNPDASNKVYEPIASAVNVTSEDPFTVDYVLNPAAVWSDGEPIDCDDFYLAWRSSNGKDGNRKDDKGVELKDEEGNPVPVWNTEIGRAHV